MKKSIMMIAAFTLAALISHAQTEKGSQTLGLNAMFQFNSSNDGNISPVNNSSTYNSNSTKSFSIGPNYSYFIADKVDIGASLSFGRSTYNYNNSSPDAVNLLDQTYYSYGGIIYLRKYFMFADKIGLRAGPYLGYTKSDNKNTYSGSNPLNNFDSKTDYYNAGAKLDLVYYPSKKLGVSLSLANLSYSRYKTDTGIQGHSDGENVDFAFVNNGLALSVFYAFGK